LFFITKRAWSPDCFARSKKSEEEEEEKGSKSPFLSLKNYFLKGKYASFLWLKKQRQKQTTRTREQEK